MTCFDASAPLHVYTDGSCQHPTWPTLRFIDSCRSDAERIWHAQKYKETGLWPTTLHVILQELCPREQNIHHAELRGLVRAHELFRHAIIHVDSSSAIATFKNAVRIRGKQLHRYVQPALRARIQRLDSLEVNQIVKIKGHDNSASLPDLDCYHSLGNAVADRAAVEVCCRLLPALTDSWEANAIARKLEVDQSYEFYQLSLALQKHRKHFISFLYLHP